MPREGGGERVCPRVGELVWERDGIPAPLVTPHYPVLEPSWSEARRRRGVGDLGSVVLFVCERWLVVRLRTGECCCVPLRGGYVPVWIVPYGLVAPFPLTVR